MRAVLQGRWGPRSGWTDLHFSIVEEVANRNRVGWWRMVGFLDVADIHPFFVVFIRRGLLFSLVVVGAREERVAVEVVVVVSRKRNRGRRVEAAADDGGRGGALCSAVDDVAGASNTFANETSYAGALARRWVSPKSPRRSGASTVREMWAL